MLKIEVPGDELWDENNEEFVPAGNGVTLLLEHSLVSISDWESKTRKRFFDATEKTQEEIMEYIKSMTINKNVDPSCYTRLTPENIQDITEYIKDDHTATTFRADQVHGHNNESVTSELIYYWMIDNGVPVEFQKWHIGRLLALLRICNIKKQPEKKVPMNETMKSNAALNAARKARLGTHG